MNKALTREEPPSSKKARRRKAVVKSLKIQRRIFVGVCMGVVVLAFIFSGKWPFAFGMLSISLTGLFEYYRMVAAKGHLPAYKMGLCVTALLMLSSAVSSSVADVVFPVGGTMICIYLLFRRSRIATIADISTTFMGLFYAGYLPSFWIRLHEYAPVSTSMNVVQSAIQYVWPSALGFSPTITMGSLLVFWTWLAAATADIGAFFFGKSFGRTRLSDISPKKTVEGAVAGFICSASVSMLGAWLLKWPLWWATGAVYGFILGVLGLCGDLFESCFKRDVGWKDSGRLFPGHGGMLDRADSYVLSAPLVYFFATRVLPFIDHIVRAIMWWWRSGQQQNALLCATSPGGKKQQLIAARYDTDHTTGVGQVAITGRYDSKKDSFGIDAAYALDDDNTVYATYGVTDEKLLSVGLENGFTAFSRRHTLDLTYFPPHDSATAKLSIRQGKTKMAAYISFDNVQKDFGKQHSEKYELDAKLSGVEGLKMSFDAKNKSAKLKVNRRLDPKNQINAEYNYVDGSNKYVALTFKHQYSKTHAFSVTTDYGARKYKVEWDCKTENGPWTVASSFPFNASPHKGDWSIKRRFEF